jgi:phosphoglycerate kinase
MPFPPHTAPIRPKGWRAVTGVRRPHNAGRARPLEKGLGNPVRPVIAIVGGAKVSSKIDLLMNLVKKVDALVIGGGMANTFLRARHRCRQIAVRGLADAAKQIMIEAAGAGCAIILPVDAVVPGNSRRGCQRNLRHTDVPAMA